MHSIYNLYKLYIYISNLYRVYIEQRPQLLLLLLCETRSGGLQKVFEIFKNHFKLEIEIEMEIESSQSGWSSSTYVCVTHTQCGRTVVYRGGRDTNCICKRKQSKLTERERETKAKTESETEAREHTICVCLHRNAIYVGKGAGSVGGDGNVGGVGVSSIIDCIIGCNASAIFTARGRPRRRRRQL